MTGSLGDPATLKLVDQEDQEDEDEDLLLQAAAQDVSDAQLTAGVDDVPSSPQSCRSNNSYQWSEVTIMTPSSSSS